MTYPIHHIWEHSEHSKIEYQYITRYLVDLRTRRTVEEVRIHGSASFMAKELAKLYTPVNHRWFSR